MKKPLKFALFGAGFWSYYQLAGWKEAGGAECAAIYNRTRERGEKLAGRFGVQAVYDDPEELLRREELDFVDIVTGVESHASLVELAARHGKDVICQKPMGRSLPEAQLMVEVCRRAGVRFFIHENWRWQTPIMALREALAGGTIGFPFRARIEMISGFPVFENQPALKELEQFILTDLGSHLLDVARGLFGEAESLFCHTQRMRPDIRGEDSATVLMQMGEGASVICAMAYAGNFLERERFPETFFFVEGTRGSIELGPDYWLRITTSEGTLARRHPPPRYAWADPAYDVVHASIVPCNRDLLNGLHGMAGGQTNAEDNLRTVELVFASYESALRKEVIRLKP